jgi:hypothetical protein
VKPNDNTEKKQGKEQSNTDGNPAGTGNRIG